MKTQLFEPLILLTVKRTLLLFFCALISSVAVFGQTDYSSNSNKVWAFGSRAGMNFTSGSPVSIGTSISTSEGCASVADRTTGALLFYTDGKNVYNSTGAIMPTGSSIVSYGTSSATQGALIVPVPGFATQYYVFSLENVYGTTNYNHLSYCKVDMSLAGGLGDVIASTLTRPIDSLLGEGLRAVSAPDCSIWVLAHRKDSAIFVAYHITAAGVSPTPVYSRVGTFRGLNSYGLGVIKATPDGTKLVQQCYNLGTAVGTELYDFNAGTGVVSNCRVLDSLDSQYGAEFSADNTKLYAHQVTTGTQIYQYDVTGPTAAAIRATRTLVASSTEYQYTDLKLGPDGKMYCLTIAGTGTSLDAFNFPNLAGLASGYTAAAVPITTGTGTLGLPNLVVGTGNVSSNSRDTTVCVPIDGHIILSASYTGSSYSWSTGAATSSISITDTGLYTISVDTSTSAATGGCGVILDSIRVIQPTPDTIKVRTNITHCTFPTTVYLSAPTGFFGYLWDNATTASTRSVSTAAGSHTYWVSYHDSCYNVTIDSIHVTIVPPDTAYGTTVNDSMCVSAAPFTLTAPPGYNLYSWNTGSATSTNAVSVTGTYWSYAVDTVSCHVHIDTTNVTFYPFPVINLGNDTAFCIGDTITLSSVQPAGSSYLWSNGRTGTSIQAYTSGTYWLQVKNGYGTGCSTTDSIHVLVSPYPIVDLGPDTGNCSGTPIVLSSSVSYIAPVYTWDNRATTPTRTVNLTGTYWLNVFVAGCSSTDTINVTIIYDTFTLYNSDTAICKGAEVQARVTANPAATFQWVPTAGVSASTTSSPLILADTSAIYQVNISIAGCPVKSDSFFIDVQPIPQVSIGNNRFVCQHDTLHLISTVTPAWYAHYAYHWSPGTDLDDSTVPNVVYTSAGDSTKMILTVTTPYGCTGSDSVLIFGHHGDFGSISTTDTNICPHDTLQIIASGGVGYHWSPGLYVSDSNSAAPTINAITNQHYTVVITDQYGCTDTVRTYVSVTSGATLLINPDSVTIYPGETYQITPQTNCTRFAWFPTAGLSSASVSNPIASPELSTKYIVHGWTEWGCSATDSIIINSSEESLLAVPNAFTPGNGPNGKFQVILRGEAKLNHMRIFNRWGTKVYESSDINDGWDGTFNGTAQPFDVYVYDIEAVTSTGRTFSKHGNVTLIR